MKKLHSKKGERLAARYLLKQGFSVEARNRRFGRAEVDIIARKGNLLVFVEVKMRNSTAFGYPETFVSARQQDLYHEAAALYMETIPTPSFIQFDIIALHKKQNEMRLQHFEDAF